MFARLLLWLVRLLVQSFIKWLVDEIPFDWP